MANKFSPQTPEEARGFLRMCPLTQEEIGNRVRAGRALLPVVSPDELRRNQEYLQNKGYPGPWPEPKNFDEIIPVKPREPESDFW